jgi:hypothetical protein
MTTKLTRTGDAGLKSQIKNLERRIQGHNLVPSADPTTIVQRPWSSYTYRQTISDLSTQQTVTVADIFTGMASVAGLTPSEIKFREVRVWGPSGAGMSLEVRDPLNNGKILTSMTDMSGLATRPRMGYAFPMQIACQPATSNTNALIIFSSSSSSTSGGALGEFHILLSYKM